MENNKNTLTPLGSNGSSNTSVDNKVVQTGATYINLADRRDQLIKDYYDGSSGISEYLKKRDRNNIEHMVIELLEEMLRETDNLKGNELIASEEGDIKASTVISSKRIEAIKEAIKAVQAKQLYEKDTGINVDSPAIMVVFKFFMKNAQKAFTKTGYNSEASDTFFSALAKQMTNWKKELQEDIDALNSVGGV